MPTNIGLNGEAAVYEKASSKEANGLTKLARLIEEDSSNSTGRSIEPLPFHFTWEKKPPIVSEFLECKSDKLEEDCVNQSFLTLLGSNTQFIKSNCNPASASHQHFSIVSNSDEGLTLAHLSIGQINRMRAMFP